MRRLCVFVGLCLASTIMAQPAPGAVDATYSGETPIVALKKLLASVGLQGAYMPSIEDRGKPLLRSFIKTPFNDALEAILSETEPPVWYREAGGTIAFFKDRITSASGMGTPEEAIAALFGRAGLATPKIVFFDGANERTRQIGGRLSFDYKNIGVHRALRDLLLRCQPPLQFRQVNGTYRLQYAPAQSRIEAPTRASNSLKVGSEIGKYVHHVFSEDGYYVYLLTDRLLKCYRVATGSEIASVSHAAGQRVILSPENRFVAVVAPGKITAYSYKHLRRVFEATTEADDSPRVAFTSDASGLLVAGAGKLRLHRGPNWSQGVNLDTLAGDLTKSGRIELAPDGKTLLILGQSSINAVNLATATEVWKASDLGGYRATILENGNLGVFSYRGADLIWTELNLAIGTGNPEVWTNVRDADSKSFLTLEPTPDRLVHAFLSGRRGNTLVRVTCKPGVAKATRETKEFRRREQAVDALERIGELDDPDNKEPFELIHDEDTGVFLVTDRTSQMPVAILGNSKSNRPAQMIALENPAKVHVRYGDHFEVLDLTRGARNLEDETIELPPMTKGVRQQVRVVGSDGTAVVVACLEVRNRNREWVFRRLVFDDLSPEAKKNKSTPKSNFWRYGGKRYPDAVSADGRVGAIHDGSGTVRIMNLVANQILQEFKREDLLLDEDDAARSIAVALNPDGSLFASRTRRGIAVRKVANGEAIRTPDRTDIVATTDMFFQFDRSGRYLFSGRSNKGVNVIDVLDLSLKKWVLERPAFAAVAASRTGEVFFATDEGIEVHGDGRPPTRIPLKLADRIQTFETAVDGKNLFAITAQGRILILRPPGGIVATHVSLPGGEYVTYTPDNFYLASKNAARAIEFVQNKVAYPFEQFDVQRNKPHLVLQRIGRAGTKEIELLQRAWVERLFDLGLKPDQVSDSYNVPSVDFTTSQDIATTRKIEVGFVATDSKAPIETVEVFVNGVPVYRERGIKESRASGKRVTRKVPIELGIRQNSIVVIAWNSEGARSAPAKQEVVFNDPSVKPNLYVLAVGVGKAYTGEWLPLNGDADARRVAAAFQGLAPSGLYGNAKVRVLDTGVTREAIQSAAKEAFAGSTVDDVAVLYLAGHGDRSSREFVFVTPETSRNDPQARGLTDPMIKEILSSVPARKRMLLIDACEAGNTGARSVTVDKTKREPLKARARGAGFLRVDLESLKADQLMREIFRDLRRDIGAVEIAASSAAESAIETSSGGVFTTALLLGLSGKADDNDDHIITTSELGAFVAEHVPKLQDGQRPEVRRDNVDLDFQFALVPETKKKT